MWRIYYKGEFHPLDTPYGSTTGLLCNKIFEEEEIFIVPHML
jgi:hypothetical protein